MILKNIDTEKKEITIDQNINMGDLVKELKNLFKDNWKDWDIIVDNKIEYIPYYPSTPYWHDNDFYYGQPTTICVTNDCNTLVTYTVY